VSSYIEKYRPVVEAPRLPPAAVQTMSVAVAVMVPPDRVELKVMELPPVV